MPIAGVVPYESDHGSPVMNVLNQYLPDGVGARDRRMTQVTCHVRPRAARLPVKSALFTWIVFYFPQKITECLFRLKGSIITMKLRRWLTDIYSLE